MVLKNKSNLFLRLSRFKRFFILVFASTILVSCSSTRNSTHSSNCDLVSLDTIVLPEDENVFNKYRSWENFKESNESYQIMMLWIKRGEKYPSKIKRVYILDSIYYYTNIGYDKNIQRKLTNDEKEKIYSSINQIEKGYYRVECDDNRFDGIDQIFLIKNGNNVIFQLICGPIELTSLSPEVFQEIKESYKVLMVFSDIP